MPGIMPRAAVPPSTLAAVILFLTACSAAPTRVSDDPAGGFALYRSGQMSASELAELCRFGIEEMLVLDGSAGDRECAMRGRVCPELKVRYNTAQDARWPVTAQFLASFDAWIEEARAAGRKVAFRCRHGWHRAGRLTAWYRMRFDGATADAAVAEMQRVGRFMDRHPQLVPQVRAMADLLAGQPCSTAAAHCVVADGRNQGGGVFAADVCP
jgi:protein-tyrosine phosphatase